MQRNESNNGQMNNYIGKKLGNYRICRLLGQGGFAEVYLGEHLYLKTLAAVKVLHARLSDTARDHFLTEARTIAHIEHLNIVPVLEFGMEGDTPYIVMSYISDGTVKTRYPDGTQVQLPIVINHTKQLASALQHAHTNNLLHRDVKPENILLRYNGQVLLSDFGLTSISQTPHKQRQHKDGTTRYMAPEQLQGKPDKASDQYALGIIVYEWLCGQQPFNGNDQEVAQQHLDTPPPSLRKLLPALPITLEQAVMKALAKDPQQRFPSVQDFAQTLEQVYYVNERLVPTVIPAPQNSFVKITPGPVNNAAPVLASSAAHDSIAAMSLNSKENIHIPANQTTHTPVTIIEEIPVIDKAIKKQSIIAIDKDSNTEQEMHQEVQKERDTAALLSADAPGRHTTAQLPAATRQNAMYPPLTSRRSMETPAVSIAALKGSLDNDETHISRRTMAASMLGMAVLGGGIFWFLHEQFSTPSPSAIAGQAQGTTAGFKAARPTATPTARATSVPKKSTKTPSHASSVTAQKPHNTTSVPETVPTPQPTAAPPKAQPTPTATSQPTPQPTAPPAPLQVNIVAAPALVINQASYNVTVSTGRVGVTVALTVNYTGTQHAQTVGPLLTDNNGGANFNWYVNTGRTFSRNITAELVATATAQQQHASSTTLSIPVLTRFGG